MHIAKLLQLWTAASSEPGGVVTICYEQTIVAAKGGNTETGAAKAGAGAGCNAHAGGARAEAKAKAGAGAGDSALACANPHSPAFQLLMRIEDRKRKRAEKQQLAAPPPPRVPHAPAVVGLQRFCWQVGQIRGLVRWLHQRQYRYTYGDWERTFAAPRRQWIRTQRGRFVGHTVTDEPRRYRCELARDADAPQPLHMSVTVEHRRPTPAAEHDPSEWASATVQQRRMYQCGAATRLHMATTHGRWYRVWIEIDMARRDAATDDGSVGSPTWLCAQVAAYFARCERES